MDTKPHKKAFYVFMNQREIHEIEIRVGAGMKYNCFSTDERVVSGTGKRYVVLDLLNDLLRARCRDVRAKLKRTFNLAHSRMQMSSGAEFSKEFDIETLLD